MSCSSEKLKNLDRFGSSPQLNVNGQKSYQTTLGGLISLMMYILILVPFVVEASKLVGRNEATV